MTYSDWTYYLFYTFLLPQSRDSDLLFSVTLKVDRREKIKIDTPFGWRHSTPVSSSWYLGRYTDPRLWLGSSSLLDRPLSVHPFSVDSSRTRSESVRKSSDTVDCRGDVGVIFEFCLDGLFEKDLKTGCLCHSFSINNNKTRDSKTSLNNEVYIIYYIIYTFHCKVKTVKVYVLVNKVVINF